METNTAGEWLPPGRARGKTVQEQLDEEEVEVPWVLRQERYQFLGTQPLSRERYYSRDWLAEEYEKVWKKTWQLACFEQDIPEVGDHVVYDIMDSSFIVVRTAPDEIKAYYNSCLHRGRQLRSTGGRVPQLRCPYHGIAWNLDGTLKEVPAPFAWDFPKIDPGSFCLPEARIETWDGLVFLNMDESAEPLSDFLGELVGHFERWPFKNRWKSAHVAKVVPSNWKAAAEAFMESYHVLATHPQTLAGGDGSNCEYDIYENFNRMILAPPIPNPNIPAEITEQDVMDEVFYNRQWVTEEEHTGSAPVEVPMGMTARQVMAEARRKQFSDEGIDGADWTIMELAGTVQYWLFPNIFPWAGSIFYRFRPNGWDPDTAIMEVIMLMRWPEGKKRPPAAKVHWLTADQDWTAAPELGDVTAVLNQDMANLICVQRGVKNAKEGTGLTLANYEDNRIRHMHQCIDRWMGRES